MAIQDCSMCLHSIAEQEMQLWKSSHELILHFCKTGKVFETLANYKGFYGTRFPERGSV
jgi:hypothetical protein